MLHVGKHLSLLKLWEEWGLEFFLWYILEEESMREKLIIFVQDKLSVPAFRMVTDQNKGKERW
jgi:hypothetical protein